MSRAGEVVRANPGLRRTAIVSVALAALIGAAAISIVTSRLRDAQSVESLRTWLWVTIALMSLGSASGAAYAARLAGQIVRAGRYPLPGQRVVRDTPVKRDADADRTALLLRAVALIMGTASVALPLLVWRLLLALPARQ